jgi:hypothetical protein
VNGAHITQKKEHVLADCPNCSSNFKARGSGQRALYDACQFCGVPLIPIWWQRMLVVAVALVVSFMIPVCLSLAGMTFLFVAILCVFPAIPLAHILVFMTVKPIYVRKSEAVTTLFRR